MHQTKKLLQKQQDFPNYGKESKQGSFWVNVEFWKNTHTLQVWASVQFLTLLYMWFLAERYKISMFLQGFRAAMGAKMRTKVVLEWGRRLSARMHSKNRYHSPNPLRQGCNRPSEDSASQTWDGTSSGGWRGGFSVTFRLLKNFAFCVTTFFVLHPRLSKVLDANSALSQNLKCFSHETVTV